MDLQKVKKMYISQRRILDILEEGNIHDERYKLLLRGLSVADVDNMRKFVSECEDKGVQLTVKKELN